MVHTVAEIARRPVVRALAIAVVALAAGSAGGATSANAADHRHLGSFAEEVAGNGVLTHHKRVAVEKATGLLFVANTVNDTVDVYRPTPTGAEPLTSLGAGQLSDPFGLAIDQSSGAVYVSDAGNGRIAKFLDDGAPTPSFTEDPAFRSPAPGGAAGELHGFAAPLAVDPVTGDLLVADPGDGTAGSSVVERFEANGTPAGSFDGGSSPGGAFTGLVDIAVGSRGDIVVVDATGDPATNPIGMVISRVERFSSDGAVHKGSIGSVATAATVAIDTDTDDVYVSGNQNSVDSSQLPTVYRFTSDGRPLETIVLPATTLYSIVTGMALDDGPTARIYVATDVDVPYGGAYGESSMQAYEVPQPAAPSVQTGSSSYVSAESVRVAATVDPNLSDTTYWVEYGTSAGYGSRFPMAPGSDAGDGDDPVGVGLQLTGLEAARTYHYRFVAHNSLGTSFGADRTVTTDESTPRAEVLDRAYEMVSPVDKGGIPVGQDNDASVVTGQIAPDANRMFYSARGAFFPTDRASYLRTLYMSERTARGWTSRNIEAPMTPSREVQAGSVLKISADGSRTFVRSTAVLAPGAIEDRTNLYIRSNASGEYEFVATIPYSATSPFVDATRDLGHVVFSTKAALTADALTGEKLNVYEWTAGHLKLVNYLPDGGGGRERLE